MTNTSLTPPPRHKRQLVADRLRTLAGQLAPGDRVPSAPDLARQFGVASGTAQAAIEALCREGLLVSRRGSGTFVVGRRHPQNEPAARAKTSTLAVFALHSSSFSRNFVAHLVTEAVALGLAVECRYADRDPDARPLRLEDVLRFEALEPAGFVFVQNQFEAVAAAMIARGHKAVILGEPEIDRQPRVPAVYADAEQGGYLAAKHLLALGHRRIAFLHNVGVETLRRRRRWRGHERALQEADLLSEPARCVLGGLNQAASWCRDVDAVRACFSAPDAPTAVAAWTDELAVMLIGALLRAGLRVPEDVSVVGYDNLPLSEHCWPALDSVDQHLDVQARHALSLLTLSAPQQVVSRALITPTLVRRASCAPPRDPSTAA